MVNKDFQKWNIACTVSLQVTFFASHQTFVCYCYFNININYTVYGNDHAGVRL